MDVKLLISRLMIALLCLQMFNIGVRGGNASGLCFKHEHSVSMAGLLFEKLTKCEAGDESCTEDPAGDKSMENCDFADLLVFHEHIEIVLPSLFHIERKNNNHHFADDLKSHVLAVVSPPPEC